jgi:hypothetical protein
MLTIQLTYLAMTSNLIMREKISRLEKLPLTPRMLMIQLIFLETTSNLIPLGKISHLKQFPVIPLMLMIQLPSHNLKISSTHTTNYVDKPGKKQSKGKIPRTTSKATSNDNISYNGLPEINHSDNPTGNKSNTEKKGWKVLLEMTTMHLLMSRMKMITLKKRIHCLLNRKSSFRK